MTEKRYTTIEVIVELKLGLLGGNAAFFAYACEQYGAQGNRTVLVRNLSSPDMPQFQANGSNLGDLFALQAVKGNKLEIRVEGEDELAGKFCDEIKRGLKDEMTCLNVFYKQYQRH
jgi:phosphotransferase system HPr-like phosphotransfer protein